jgi:hypothetical protein
VSPILTRPIREQLEHDRIIRQLQPRYKRRHDVAINPGPEQNESIMVGDLAVYPDLVLFSMSRSRKLEGTVEVETGESVNALEALAEWGVFSRLKVPFHLYVPPQSLDTARRLCEEHGFNVAEIWTYHLGMDQVRFTQVYRAPSVPAVKAPPPKPPAAKSKPPARRVTTANGKAAKNAKSAKNGKAANNGPKAARPAAKAKAKPATARKPAKAASPARSAPKKAAKASKRAPAGKRR